MYRNIVVNDIKKNKIIAFTITMFIFLAVLLTSLAASMGVNLSNAIDNNMQLAQTPSLMQMHAGKVDQARLKRFAKEHKNVEKYQTLPFLNIQGSEIAIGDHLLSDSVQDNGVTTQGKNFDYLLGIDGKVIHPKDGEIYVSLYYLKEGKAKIGDTVSIHGVKFKLAGFLRDSQMNAEMIGSKRFLVNENGYKKLEKFGRLETLIEFKLRDQSKVGDFANDYLEAGLESNGPSPVTYQNFKLANAITDGMMIAVLVIVSLLVILVTFLCIRFTLLAKIEEDYKEIGVLKAIGIRLVNIRKIYLAKYGILAGLAGFLGFLSSIILQKALMKNIRLFFGESENAMIGLLFGLFGALLIVGIILLYTNGLLRKFKKISAAQAIRFGAPEEKTKTSNRLILSSNKLFSTNLFLGFKDVLARKKLYITMLVVLIVSCFLMILPRNIYNTISSRNFMTYIGIGRCDNLFNIQQIDNIPGKTDKIADDLSKDTDVEKYSVLTSYMFDTTLKDNTTRRIKINLGDHQKFPIAYGKGHAPKKKTEIALSNFLADDLKKKVGDTLVLSVDGANKKLVVSGVYSDVTNGGRTAKASFKVDPKKNHVVESSIPVILKSGIDVKQKAQKFKEIYSYVKVADSESHIQQTLGSTVSGIRTASYGAIATTVLLILLVTVLFMKLLTTKDRFTTAALKSFGFMSKSIRTQYIARSGVILVIGVVLGTLLANTAGEYIGTMLISAMGITSIKFEINPFFAYLIAPVLIACCVYVATVIGTRDINSIKISEYIKE